MNDKNNIRNDNWEAIDREVKRFEKTLKIPSKTLLNVPQVDIGNQEDILNIPNTGGCYWIWTNEPVNHTLHRNRIPEFFRGGQIIYNGIAKDDIRGRVKHHLFAKANDGWSAISIDILKAKVTSHRKKAMTNGNRDKVAYLDNERITTREQLLQLHLSEQERHYITNSNRTSYFFRNGINITEPKHQEYTFKVFFIVHLTSLSYLEFVEKAWRKKNGLPRLCSYSSGR